MRKIAFHEKSHFAKLRMRKIAFCETSHFAEIRMRKFAFRENSQNFASLRKNILIFFAFESHRKMILKNFRIRIASHFKFQCEGTSLTGTVTSDIIFIKNDLFQDSAISFAASASESSVHRLHWRMQQTTNSSSR